MKKKEGKEILDLVFEENKKENVQIRSFSL